MESRRGDKSKITEGRNSGVRGERKMLEAGAGIIRVPAAAYSIRINHRPKPSQRPEDDLRKESDNEGIQGPYPGSFAIIAGSPWSASSE